MSVSGFAARRETQDAQTANQKVFFVGAFEVVQNVAHLLFSSAHLPDVGGSKNRLIIPTVCALASGVRFS